MERKVKDVVCRYCGDKKYNRSCEEVKNSTLAWVTVAFIAIATVIVLVVKYVLCKH